MRFFFFSPQIDCRRADAQGNTRIEPGTALHGPGQSRSGVPPLGRHHTNVHASRFSETEAVVTRPPFVLDQRFSSVGLNRCDRSPTCARVAHLRGGFGS